MKEIFDAIVIGSGAGGGTAAYKLVSAGLNVLLLEQGPRFDRYKDFSMTKNDWERWDHFERENPDTYTASPRFLGDSAKGLMSTIHNRRLKRMPESVFRYERATGLGGSTLRYQAETHRFPAHAFKMKSHFGIAEDWPLTYKDLEPFYEEAEDLLGVAGNHKNPFKPVRGPFPMRAHPLGCPSQRVRSIAKKLGLTLMENSLAIPNRPYRGRPACIYCRGCGYGCVIGDKGSTEIVMIQPAESTGRLSVKTGARVLSIGVNKKGRVESVLWKSEKGTEKSFGRTIVVSCGAIETPRLLLNSTSSLFPDGLANSNGMIGRYLMTHLSVYLMVLFDRPLKSYQGLPIDSRIWDFSAPLKVKEQGGGFALGVMGAPEGIVSPARFASIAPGWGKSHKAYMRRYYGAQSALFGVAEQHPRKENAVILAEAKDAYGMQKAEILVGMEDNELGLLRQMLRRCNEIADAGGLEKVATFTSLDSLGSTHVGGTTRMGTDKEKSVLNSFGQSHDIKNLFVADASTMVTQGCGDSPALTIMALALRTADYLVSELKKGTI